MENKIKPVPVILDHERRLLCDVNALIALGDELQTNMMTPEAWEELFGKSCPADSAEAKAFLEKAPQAEIKDGLVFVPSTPSFRKIRAIVWALLLHEDENLTVRQVGAMLDPAKLQPVMDAYIQAITASQGDSAKKEQSAEAGA